VVPPVYLPPRAYREARLELAGQRMLKYALKIRLLLARSFLTWRPCAIHRGQRITATKTPVHRSQTFAGRHLQSKDDRWILHKEEWAGDGCMEQIDLTSDDSWSVLIGVQQMSFFGVAVWWRYVLNAFYIL
jgi:hypothetical protein